MENLLYLLVSFLASVAGAICGIGGGVIIKPVLDLCGLASVSTISFLSGCTVLSMSCYNVVKNIRSGENRVSFRPERLWPSARLWAVSWEIRYYAHPGIV